MSDRDYNCAERERTAYITTHPGPVPAPARHGDQGAEVADGADCDTRDYHQAARELAILRARGGGDGPAFPVAAAPTQRTPALTMNIDRDFAQAARDLTATRAATMTHDSPLDRDFNTAEADLALTRRWRSAHGSYNIDRNFETAAKDLARFRAGSGPTTYGFDRGFSSAASERIATVAASQQAVVDLRIEIAGPEPLLAVDNSEDRCFRAKARPTAPLDRDFNVAQRELAETQRNQERGLSTIDRDFGTAAADLARLRAAAEVVDVDRSFVKAATDGAAVVALVAVRDTSVDRDYRSAARDLAAMLSRSAGRHMCDGANHRSSKSDKQRANDLQLIARAMADPFGHRRGVVGVGQPMKKPARRSKRSAGYSARAHIPMLTSHRQLGRNAR